MSTISILASPESGPATGFSHYFDGQWQTPAGDETVEVVNPATEEVIAKVPRATTAEAERAIQSARTAFDEGEWPRMPGKERARIMRQFADALRSNRDKIADIVTRQGGATTRQTQALQVNVAFDLVERAAELAAEESTELAAIAGGPFGGSPMVDGIGSTLAVREPVGVVAAITPFNFPFYLNIAKIAPALAAGCTVVLKPTDFICLDSIEIARILDEETDLPKGAFNLLLGGGPDVGEVLTGDPRVDHVTFTGSTATGRRIMRTASETIKRVTLELGGKSARIIFADTDLERAMVGDCGLVISHCGQSCSATTRMLIEDSIHDEVVERLIERAKSVTIGDPADPGTELGPLVNAKQWERVNGYIQLGIEEGATLAYGGKRPDHLERGYFMEPTIFTDVRNDMRIAQEEIFGPVLCVERFSTEEEAIALANDSIYGLGGAVWSGDLQKALRVASQMKTGMVLVNGMGDLGWDFPFGGYKQSGLGREFGKWGYEEFTELKALRYNAR